jgi:TRAP-type uncharacterized transport system substrate-binding protein
MTDYGKRMLYADLLAVIDKTLASLQAHREARGEAGAEKLPLRTLRRLFGQIRDWLRKLLLPVAILCLLPVMVYFIWESLPAGYALTISGGDILSNRNLLAVALRDAGVGAGLKLTVRPFAGTFDILEAVNEKKIDIALIHGGLDTSLPNIEQVAAILPETLHLLVREEINSLKDLKGKIINLGSSRGGTRVIGEHVLAFSELRSGIDYALSNHEAEELLALPARKMPDAVLNLSTVPSVLAESLIRDKGYKLLEIPFPKALSLRHGWVADVKLFPYTYKIHPPVPDKEIASVGVNLFMVCNKDVPDMAVFKLLETLYSDRVRKAVHATIDTSTISIPSGYPLSTGTKLFMSRNEPLLSKANLERYRTVTSLFMTCLTLLAMILRWHSGSNERESIAAKEICEYISLTALCNQTLLILYREKKITYKQIQQFSQRIVNFKAALLERVPQIENVNFDSTILLFKGIDILENTLSRLNIVK